MKRFAQLLIVLISLFLPAQGAPSDFIFKHFYDPSHPLTNIVNIDLDRNGMVWVSSGTYGLFRFDGYNYRTISELSGTDSRATAIWDSQWQEGVDASQWKSYEIHPTTPWNYALVDEAPITVVRSAWKEGANPFTLENVPLRFEATGRLVPSWGLDETGTCQVLPSPEAPCAEQRDPITLVPMGAARLRISAFPQAD